MLLTTGFQDCLNAHHQSCVARTYKNYFTKQFPSVCLFELSLQNLQKKTQHGNLLLYLLLLLVILRFLWKMSRLFGPIQSFSKPGFSINKEKSYLFFLDLASHQSDRNFRLPHQNQYQHPFALSLLSHSRNTKSSQSIREVSWEEREFWYFLKTTFSTQVVFSPNTKIQNLIAEMESCQICKVSNPAFIFHDVA